MTKVDYLVIGGGLAGLSAAAALAPRGGRVLVLEREEALGYHSSGRSAAMFEANYGPAPVQVLSRASEAHHRAKGCLSPRGMLLVGGTDQAEIFQTDCADLGLTPITVAAACEMVPVLDPEQVGFAAYHDAAQDLDADLLLQGFARAVRTHGGEIRTRARIIALNRTAAEWQVDIVGDQITAGTIINAAGAWADELATLAGIAPIGLQPKRRSMARLPAPGGHDVSHWPMTMGAGETWYAKPDAGKLLVSPAEADPVPPQDAYADDMVLAEGLARYEAMVTTPVTRVEHNWAGLRSFVADGVPVLGPDPAETRFVWCAGQGGYGVQTSPAAGRLIADLVTGHPPEIDAVTLASLSPERLR
ncbi:NAD(P)/FAD-dependent oxidoreductase [Phaeobacter porticola]|uniref:FAD dependent oxidoreductase n=1 Tax=Phaeobacter porticola TaxID=1844006 RepID=A0A1L3I1V8_9RHOB|nr:FAD-binding oxidoreductase [Phaeobacter porticola]APG46121.1 FAD dependent oxidoreductase [Phaeobacter porticola]